MPDGSPAPTQSAKDAGTFRQERLWFLLAHPAPGLIPFSQSMPTFAKIIFVVALALSFTGWLSPPIALTVGILFGLSFKHPYMGESRGVARTLLQCSVLPLGSPITLHQLFKPALTAFISTPLGI